MRLLYVLPEYPPHHGGGIVTFYEALLPALVQQGHEVDVLVGSAFTADEAPYERDGVRVSFLEGERFRRYIARFGAYEALPELQRYLAAAWAMHEQKEGGAGYDAVEVVDWGLLFVPWVVEPAAPAIVQLHGSTGQIDFRDPSPGAALQGHVTRLLEAEVMRAAAGVHTHSSVNLAEWEAATGRPVTYLAPPLPLWPSEPRERTERGLVVGRIQRWKGPTVLCEALRRMGNAAPEIDWIGRDTILGESGGSMDAYLAATYPDVWGRTVAKVGQVPPARVAELQAEAGFVVVPSLWDVFNLTAVEAMRSGAVVICSMGAGAADLVEDGVTGFTFPVGDAEALAAKLEAVQALSIEAKAVMGAAAQRLVGETLVPERVAADKVAAYQEAIETGAPFALNPWAAEAAHPAGAAPRPLAFLDQQPLSGLLRYAGRRLRDKLVPGR
ncbi:MAG: glycosyltransferase family 4 protein [Rhodothermales bacterium]